MEKSISRTQSEVSRTLTMLSDTPKRIAAIVRGCSDVQLHRKPAPDAWSARDIVAHLRACADVWGQSIDRMVAEDHPTVRYVSPRGWIKQTDYLDQGFRDSLRAFAKARAGLLRTLRALDAAGWSRRGTFTGSTLGREATVLSFATRIADHEVGHLEQLQRTLPANEVLGASQKPADLAPHPPPPRRSRAASRRG
jgi:hypothetical protein